MCEEKLICDLNSLKQRLSQNVVPTDFMFDPLIRCDLFVKFFEMAGRNHRKSSVLQMVKTLLLADDSTNHRVEKHR